MINAVSLILSSSALVLLITGALVYATSKAKLQNSIWLIFNILFCIWNFCLYMAFDTATKSSSLYWVRSALGALIFMVPAFLHFLSFYSDKEVFKRRTLYKIYGLFFLIFIASFFMPEEFVKDLRHGAYFKYTIVPGIGFHVLTVLFVGFTLCGFYYLLRSKKLYVTIKRNQRMWIFIGMFFGMLAPLNVILASYKIEIIPFGLFCVIPYLALVSYAVYKYHVLEIDIVINKTVILAYLTLFVIVFHIMGVYILNRIVGMEYLVSSVVSGSIILLNLLFTVHYMGIVKLNKFVDDIAYEKKVRYYRFLENYNTVTSVIKNFHTLLYYMLDSLKNIIDVDHAFLYLYDEKNLDFRLAVHRGLDKEKLQPLDRISPNSPLVSFLKEGNIFSMDDAKDFVTEYKLEDAAEAFASMKVKLITPLYYSLLSYYERSLIGFLSLGEKRGHAKYMKEDIDIVNAFSRQLGSCLDSERLRSQAIEDDLTKICRYNYFHKRLEEEIERYKRHGKSFSVLMIDVDNFKKINDIFGHQVGNEVLKRIAFLIKSDIRKSDIASRYGGEEFAVLLVDTDRSRAHAQAEHLRKIIEEDFRNPETQRYVMKKEFSKIDSFIVTLSIGVASYVGQAAVDQLIKKADEALYKAKAEGKNRVAVGL